MTSEAVAAYRSLLMTPQADLPAWLTPRWPGAAHSELCPACPRGWSLRCRGAAGGVRAGPGGVGARTCARHGPVVPNKPGEGVAG